MEKSALSENESFLRDFHRRFPGCTPVAFASGRVSAARAESSYGLLASLVPGEGFGPLTVLDLACGDGYLLERLALRRQAGLRLVGVDLSEGELMAARSRPTLAEATLLEGRAQALPLPDASVDFVVSHMALMLMDEMERVVGELKRVLKPGGSLAAIVGYRPGTSPAEEVFARLLGEALGSEGKEFIARLGDRRMRASEGIAELFGTAAGFAAQPAIEELTLRREASPEEARDYFLLMYDVARLSREGRARFADRLLTELLPLAGAAGGTLELAAGMRLITNRT